MIRRPPRSTLSSSSAASDVYKRQALLRTKLSAIVQLGAAGVVEGAESPELDHRGSKIEHMCSCCGVDQGIAQTYLIRTKWNLDQAKLQYWSNQARAGRVAQRQAKGLVRTLSTIDYDDRRLLWVMLLEGRDISTVPQQDECRSEASKFLSNYMFCELTIGSQKSKTHAVRIERSPEWNECFAFMVHTNQLWDSEIKVNLFTQDNMCVASGSVPLALPDRGSTHHALVPLLSTDIDAAHSGCGKLHVAMRRSLQAVDADPNGFSALRRTRSVGSAAQVQAGSRIALEINQHSWIETEGAAGEDQPSSADKVSVVAFKEKNQSSMLRFVSTVSSAGKLHWLQHGGRLHCLLCNGENDSCEHHYCIKCMGTVQDGSCDCQALGDPVGSCAIAVPQDQPEIEPAFVEVTIDELLSSMPDVVRCPNPTCGMAFIAEPLADLTQAAPADINDPRTGLALQGDALADFNTHRFRCPECAENFCSGCNALPYHTGHTCEQAKAAGELKICRFCGAPVEAEPAAGEDGEPPPQVSEAIRSVCASEECQGRAAQVCLKKLECEHWCCGSRDEAECPPCIQCAEPDGAFCTACWVEELHQAPCVTLPCSHVFHRHCIEAMIQAGWANSRIDFSHLECPVCRGAMCPLPVCNEPDSLGSLISHWKAIKSAPISAGLECLSSVLTPELEVQAVVINRALEQADRDGLDKDEAVASASGRFYKDIMGYLCLLYTSPSPRDS
eukprot:TRINITY_DN44392_c0_g1_i1.p1 TRINITY_DN44392_c0_g1~~TRINITY_DN44392_c0_g1_i1.p1  ORF type:complete len:728 (+),score=164.88 TRINITY_DN44392_c0_g1_i1:89-2272(+)